MVKPSVKNHAQELPRLTFKYMDLIIWHHLTWVFIVRTLQQYLEVRNIVLQLCSGNAQNNDNKKKSVNTYMSKYLFLITYQLLPEGNGSGQEALTVPSVDSAISVSSLSVSCCSDFTLCRIAWLTCTVWPTIHSSPIQTLRVPLGLKYSCPSESTWKMAVSSLLKVLSIGLPVARQHASSGRFSTMWPELANAFQDFLFTKRYVGIQIGLFCINKNVKQMTAGWWLWWLPTAHLQTISPSRSSKAMKP